MPRTTHELLDITSNHADVEEAVAATLNTPQGKGKKVMDQGEGTSMRFTKKKKNDKCRRDDNLVAAVERKASRPKSNPTKHTPSKDPFERLLDAPCPHHEVPVKHSLKHCQLIRTTSTAPSSQERRINPRREGHPPTTMTVKGLCTRVKMVRST
jgi:hypothetical protein